MARDVTIDLGLFSISNYLDKNFALTVTASLSLSLWEDRPDTPTATELCDQVKAGSLWITRAGSCNVEFSVLFDDFLDVDVLESLEHTVIRAFEGFPAWAALGLDLRPEYNQFNVLPGSVTLYNYSVQHLRQNSGLVAPNYVQCAYLSTLTCEMAFGTKTDVAQQTRKEALAVPKMTRIVNLRLPSRKLRRFAKKKQRWDGAPKMARPNKSRTITSKGSPKQLPRVARKQPVTYSWVPSLQEGRLEQLTHTALYYLLGLKKKFSDTHFLVRADSPSLLEMAPAVWNARYFLDVVSRVQLAPFISSALGALASTESANLRHRLQNLAIEPMEEIHKHLLRLTLRSSRVPRIGSRGPRTTIKSAQLPNAYDALELDDILDIDERYGQGSLSLTQSPLPNNSRTFQAQIDDGVTAVTSGTFHSNSLPYGYAGASDNLSLVDGRDPEHSSGIGTPDDQFNLRQLQRSGIIGSDLKLHDDQNEGTLPQSCSLNNQGQMLLQNHQHSSYINSKDLSKTALQAISQLYLDEAYFEPEQGRARALPPSGFLSEPTESQSLLDDDADVLYQETERKLAELLASASEVDRPNNGDTMDSDQVYLATEQQLLQLLVSRTEPAHMQDLEDAGLMETTDGNDEDFPDEGSKAGDEHHGLCHDKETSVYPDDISMDGNADYVDVDHADHGGAIVQGEPFGDSIA